MLKLGSALINTQYGYSCRMVSTTHNVLKAYDQWSYQKPARRIGRRPTYYRGQGGKKSRIPYDKRYPLSGKDINDTVEGLKRGGNKYMMSWIGDERAQSNPSAIKYYDYDEEREVMRTVKEMIPEFIVPSLASFQLKPYVSYTVSQESIDNVPAHSAAQLYKDTYQEPALDTVKQN